MSSAQPTISDSSLRPGGFEPLLDAKQAAALLKMHPKTLQCMARLGAVPALRLGDLWRFRASDLDAWVRAQICWKGHPRLD